MTAPLAAVLACVAFFAPPQAVLSDEGAAPAIVNADADPEQAAQIDALLAGLEARYANAQTYRDVAYAMRFSERALRRDENRWTEWRLAFARPEPGSDSGLRWLSDERAYRDWGFPLRDVAWASGDRYRTWTPTSRSTGKSSAGILSLKREWERLPLRLGLHDFATLEHPFTAFVRRELLEPQAVGGVLCERVSLREDSDTGYTLELWISRVDHSLRRLDHGYFGFADAWFRDEVLYHPVFDEPVPDAALAFAPPALPIAGHLSDAGMSPLLILGGLIMGALTLRLAKRREPWLHARNTLLLLMAAMQAHQAFQFFAVWARMPSEVAERSLVVPWVSVGFLVLLPFFTLLLTYREMSAFDVSGKSLRASLSALVQRRGGEPQWTQRERRFSTSEVVAIPGSELTAELVGGRLAFRGAARWGERRRLRRELERQLAEDGIEATGALALFAGIGGACVFFGGLAMLAL